MTPPTWVGTWGCAPQLTEPDNQPPAPGLTGNTLRQIVRSSIAGRRLRLELSNLFGDRPVTMHAVYIARAVDLGGVDVSTSRRLTFAGKTRVTIPETRTLLSDPFEFALAASSRIAISIEFGDVPTAITGHPGSRTTSFIERGHVGTAQTLSATTTDHWYYITGIDVETQGEAAAVVTLGDSLTDGRGSTTNGDDRWPDVLADRLQKNAATRNVAVLNQGLGGNAVLSSGLGPTAIERFERDVLGRSGVGWVIVAEGINDIGESGAPDIVGRLIGAYRHFVDAAHRKAIRIYGAPLLPLGGSHYDTEAREAARRAVNHWIRTSGEFDAVIDLEAAVRNPANPTQLHPAYDTGDGLHLNAAGYRAMGQAIPLSLFER
jgi:lysophospholipase L1-like esterase